MNFTRNRVYKVVYPLGLLCLFLSFFGSAEARQPRPPKAVTLSLQGVALDDALKQIANQVGLGLSYDPAIVPDKKVSITFEHEALQPALNRLLKGTGLRGYEDKLGVITIEKIPVQDKRATGAVRGRVVDFETLEPLPGATIFILNTSNGTSTDADGHYKVDGLAPGEYTLRYSFVGYDVNEVKNVQISAGRETVIDVKLKGAAELKEVVVEGRTTLSKAPVSYTSERDIVEAMRESNAVLSGISNEQIVKNADRNAAEVVKRVSGVTMLDDKFVVVRGMNQRYNLTYLNNNIAPSTELYSRAFAYDLLPATIIDRIIVYKSPVAELFGDYTGGAVKVFTKNAKPVRHVDVNVQLGFRQGTTGKKMNAYEARKYDWLGFDDGGRKIPGVLTSLTDKSNENALSTSAYAKLFNNNMTYGKIEASPDYQVTVNYFDNWRIGKGRLYNLTSVTKTNENRSYRQVNQTGNTYKQGLAGDRSTGIQNDVRNRLDTADLSFQINKLNVLQNFTFSPGGKRLQFEWKNFFSNDGRSYTNTEVGTPNRNLEFVSDFNDYRYRITTGFQRRMLYTTNVGGEWKTSTDSAKSVNRLQWNAGYTYALQDVPDQRRAVFYRDANHTIDQYPDYRWTSAGSNIGDGNALLYEGMIGRLWQNNTEHVYNGSLDYTHKVGDNLTLKGGYYTLFRNRVVERFFFRVNRGGLRGNEISLVNGSAGELTPSGNGANNLSLIQFTPDDLASLWSDEYFRDDNSGLKVYNTTSPVDRYLASEQNNSAYIMGDYALADKIVLNGGLRMEHHVIKLSGAKESGTFGNFVPVQAQEDKTVWLPSFNVKYTATAQLTLRSGYGRSVNRPEFRELAPFNDMDYFNSELNYGNPKLRTAEVDNVDVRVEWYPASGQGSEVVTLGGFYKKIANPIERIRNDFSGDAGATIPTITYSNAVEATVAGVEVEVRKTLAFIPGKLFRDLAVVANATLIHSEVTRHDTLIFDTPSGYDTYKRRLQGQAPYIINAGLYYENAGWGTKLSVAYNISGPSIYAASKRNPELAEVLNRDFNQPQYDRLRGEVENYMESRPNILELSRQLVDISIQQRLFKSLQLRFNIQNVFNKPVRFIEDYNGNNKRDPEYKVTTTRVGVPLTGGRYYYNGDNFYRQFNYGRYMVATLTYTF